MKSMIKLFAAVAVTIVTALPSFAANDTLVTGTGVVPRLHGPLPRRTRFRLQLLPSYLRLPLVLPDETLQPQPALATDWRLIDPLTWEFDLRKNVRFHDGTAFDANDVVFSFKRIGTVEGSDGLVADYAAPIKDVQVLNPHRIRLVTQSPTPNLIRDLVRLSIISDSIDPDSTTEDFNSGKAAIGTGPFKLVEWKRGTEPGVGAQR